MRLETKETGTCMSVVSLGVKCDVLCTSVWRLIGCFNMAEELCMMNRLCAVGDVMTTCSIWCCPAAEVFVRGGTLESAQPYQSRISTFNLQRVCNLNVTKWQRRYRSTETSAAGEVTAASSTAAAELPLHKAAQEMALLVLTSYGSPTLARSRHRRRLLPARQPQHPAMVLSTPRCAHPPCVSTATGRWC